jgi:hypothetical protein
LLLATAAPPFKSFHPLFFILGIHNALVIPGKHNGLAFFCVNSRGLLPNARALFVIPKPHRRHYKTSAVTMAGLGNNPVQVLST